METETEHDGNGAGWRGRLAAFDTVLIAGGLVLFLVLLYVMQVAEGAGRFLSPPLVAAAGVILLWPLRHHRAVRALLLSGGFLLIVWLFDNLSGVLVPFAVVYLLAYLFDPVVSYLRRRWRVARWISTLVVTLLVVGLVALFVLLLVPNIIGQVETLGTRLLGSVNELRTWIATTPLLDRLEQSGLVENLNREQLEREVTTAIRGRLLELTGSLPRATETVFQSLGSIFGLVTTLTITPVLLFYTLKDYPAIERSLIGLFPTFGGRRDYLIQAGGIVGSYLRGQLAISAIAATNVSVALVLFDVPFALLIGLLGGLLNMIPTLGVIITNIIGILIALIFGDPPLVTVVIVVGVLLGQSLLEQSVLTPKILSHQVGLHPVLILLSLFVFGYFMGIFGLFIAVPATALIMTVYKSNQDEMTLDLSNYGEPHAAEGAAASDGTPGDGAPAPDRDAPELAGTDPNPIKRLASALPRKRRKP